MPSTSKPRYKTHRQQQPAKTAQIWLYLGFPQLALDAQFNQSSEQITQEPYAIVIQSRQLQRIYCCNKAAQHYGVDVHMSLSTALALCPQLHVEPRKPSQETYYLQQLALISYSFSPTVVIYKQQGIGLELSRCEQLYGDYVTLLQRLQIRIQRRCNQVISGVGPSLQAARLTYTDKFHSDIPDNRQMSRQLHAIPTVKLAIKESQKRSFEELNLPTLGDLLALPRSSLSRRFGAKLISQIDQLTGAVTTPHTLYTPAEYFSDTLQRADGLYSKEALYAPMKDLLQRFCDYLGAHHSHCRQIDWLFSPLMGEPQSMRVQLSSGNNNYMSFFTLSRLQLERLQLAPSIESIGLYSDQFIAAPEGNLDFFSDQQQVDKNQLLDQLTAKLGSDALTRPYMLAEHLPEHANSTAGLAPAKPPIVAPPLSLNHCTQPLSHQPLWLMKHPIALPANRRQPFWRQPLTLLSGPERLCDNWWHSEQQRDYYLAHDPQGVRYWLFWEQNSQRWFVQGLFS